MKSTREKILYTMATHPRSTIQDLAEAVGINSISVRHHLSSMEADGLIAYEEQRHGVGRPRLVYYLTERGLERFPTRYLSLTNRLLEQLKQTLPPATVDRLFQEIALDLAKGYAQKAKKLSIEGKLNLVKEALAQEGFNVEWEKKSDHYQITEITCPFFHIGEKHPEVCTVDHTMISTVLNIPTEKIKCVLNGDAHCTYLIPHASLTETP